MAVQERQDNTTEPLILSGLSYVKNGIISQDAARTTDLLHNTVMAYNATLEQWGPFNDLTATEGLGVPRGIYVGDDILAADLVAGDIEDCPIIVGGCCTVNADLLVFDDGTLDLNSIVNPANIEARAAGYALIQCGIFAEVTEAISEHEN